MKLIEFVEKYICPNTLIRLWYPISGGHTLAYPTELMEWEMLNKPTSLLMYLDSTVIGVTDILVEGNYKEAVNLIIKKPAVKQTIDNLITTLKSDEDYYRTWKDNLSMCIQDEYSTNISFDVNTFANNCAHRFLQLLIYNR